jgi:hypothetical protein
LIPRSLSATALDTAELCLARFAAENIKRGRGVGDKKPADLGSTVHNTLELYVQVCYITKTQQPSLKLLLDIYEMQWGVTMGFDHEEPWYTDGQDMLTNWFERMSFEGREVLSVEVKSSFDVPTSAGPIPLNYIWDLCLRRMGDDGERIIEVWDYKTWRKCLSPEQLAKKIQARIYAMAAAIQFKDQYDVIWVRFDQLRHGDRGTVGIRFKREDLVRTWQHISAEAERIIQTDENNAPETVNVDCGYCVRKHECKALASHAGAGGLMGLEIDDMALIYERVKNQQKALKILEDELAGQLTTYVEHQMENPLYKDQDEFHLESGMVLGTRVKQSDKIINPVAVQKLLGADLFARVGNLTVTEAKKLLKPTNPTLTDDQKAELRSLIKPTVTGMDIFIKEKP